MRLVRRDGRIVDDADDDVVDVLALGRSSSMSLVTKGKNAPGSSTSTNEQGFDRNDILKPIAITVPNIIS